MKRPHTIEYRVIEWPPVENKNDGYLYSVDEVYRDENGNLKLWSSAVEIEEWSHSKLLGLINAVVEASKMPTLILDINTNTLVTKNK